LRCKSVLIHRGSAPARPARNEGARHGDDEEKIRAAARDEAALDQIIGTA
jgi:hypothetical protein